MFNLKNAELMDALSDAPPTTGRFCNFVFFLITQEDT